MSCKYNNCKHCGYKSKCEIYKENAELKEANQTLATMNESMWVELEKKRAESQGITNKLHQLIKAKEIIKKFSEFANLEVEYDPEHPQEHTDLWNKLCEEAEQFLNNDGCPDVLCEDCTKKDCGTRQLGLVGKVK